MEKLRKAGIKDLEITFVGMAFVIQGALQIIKRAIDTIKQMEEPDCTWLFRPLKLRKQNALGATIDDILESLYRYNTQLLNAISIASYAVNLESLENVLNASNMLVNNAMR